MRSSKGDVGEEGLGQSSPIDAEITAALDEDGPVRSLCISRGARVDRYEILDWIGAGGMGVVYTAHDPMLDRTVAVKLFHRPADGRPEKKETHLRFLREAQAMARLAHPNVLAVHDVGVLHGRIFIATEYVAGQTLSEWLTASHRTWPEILAVFIDAGRGLAAAHQAGIIHRDFKPSNVLVGDDGRIRVMDFGLARRLNEPEDVSTCSVEENEGETTRNALESDLTEMGAAVGTPAYMAPEQHEARNIDGRADQFGFCVALYQALYGCHPFSGSDRRAILRSIRSGRINPPRESGVPVRIRSAVLRGLAYDPDHRWPDMASLLAALGRNPKRRWVSAVALGGVALMTAGGVAIGRHAESTAHLCSGAADKVDRVWGEAQKTAVRESLMASKLPYAPTVWQRVEGLLNDYTARWATLRYEVCAATQLRHEQSEQVMDVRMTCLDKRLFEVGATIDTLRRGDPKTVQNALHMVGSMTPLQQCQDLVTAPHLAPPPGTSAEIEALRPLIAEVKALSSAGHYRRAMEVGTKVLNRAKALGWAPVTAEAAFWLGTTEQRAGKIEGAEKHLLTAAWEAEAGHDDELLVRARAMLVGLYGLDTGRFDEAELWAQQTRAALRRVDDNPYLEAHLLNSLGSVHGNRGQYRSALHEFERAITLIESVQAGQTTSSASQVAEDDIQSQVGEVVRLSGLVHNNIAAVHERLGAYEKARKHFEFATNVFETAYGPHHPLWAVTASNLGSTLHNLGQDEQARDYLERARHSLGQSVGRSHPHYASALVKLAELELDSGSLLTAEAMAQRAIETLEAFEQPHPVLLGALEQHARALAARGEPQRARPAFERALKNAESLMGPRHPIRGRLLQGLAELELAEGRAEVARKHGSLALDLLEGDLGDAHPDVATAATVLGKALHHLGLREEAKAHLERGLSIRLLAPGRPEHLADAQAALARTLFEDGQTDRGRELADAAIQGYSKAGPAGLEQAAALQAWLGAQSKD